MLCVRGCLLWGSHLELLSGKKRTQHLHLSQDAGICFCVQSEIRLPTPLCSLSFKGTKVCWTSELVERVTSVLVELPWSITWVNAVQNVAPFFAIFEMLEVDGGKDALISLRGAVDLLQSGASTWRGLPKMPSLDLTASTWTCVQWFKIWQSSTLMKSNNQECCHMLLSSFLVAGDTTFSLSYWIQLCWAAVIGHLAMV